MPAVPEEKLRQKQVSDMLSTLLPQLACGSVPPSLSHGLSIAGAARRFPGLTGLLPGMVQRGKAIRFAF